jgi:hypothetical protein
VNDPSRRVYRDVVPVDDEWHAITFSGPILAVGTRHVDYIEIWHLHNPGEPEQRREFRAFGTGHPLTYDTGSHVGSVIVAGGALVWHLFERRTT